MSEPSPFEKRPVLSRFLASPLTFFLHPVHILLLRLRGAPHLPPPHAQPIRVVCISDTHTLEWIDVPDGDLLIHAGDLANDGSVREIQGTVDWLKTLPHRHKVVIAGNHDSYFDVRSRLEEDRDKSLSSISASTSSIRSIDDPDSHRIDWGDIHYLQHSSVQLSFHESPFSSMTSSTSTLTTTHTSHRRPKARTLTIYGAPQIPAIVPFGPEHAFTYPPQQDAWTGTVPVETDILVTHTPPRGHLDLGPNYCAGCPSLLNETWRVRPTLHVFGHVHAAYGSEPVFWDNAQRAWERLSTRPAPRLSKFPFFFLGGLVRDILSPSVWVDAYRVLYHDVAGLIWRWVWGGANSGSGWMVNAACMYRDSGTLRNHPQVFEL